MIITEPDCDTFLRYCNVKLLLLSDQPFYGFHKVIYGTRLYIAFRSSQSLYAVLVIAVQIKEYAKEGTGYKSYADQQGE